MQKLGFRIVFDVFGAGSAWMREEGQGYFFGRPIAPRNDNGRRICDRTGAQSPFAERGLIKAVTDRLPGTGLNTIHGHDRDLRLDACRGLALWFVFLNHSPDNALTWLTLRNYGFSDTSEVFVFVSGYTCMLAYGGALRTQGWPTIAARAIRRCWEIYAAFLILFIVYAAMVWVIGGGHRFLDETNTGVFFRAPGAAIVHAVVLQYAPVNTDILPTFVLLHLSFPALLWLLMRFPTTVLMASAVLYLMVQLRSWHVPAWPGGEMYFNPFAWQFLFVLGAWYVCEGARRIRKVLQSPVVLAVALLYLAISLIIALSWQFKLIERLVPAEVSALIYPIYKSHLAPVRLLHLLGLAVVISRLTPRDWNRLMMPWMMAVIRCGENSLLIYCLGVLLSLLAHIILAELDGGLVMQIAVSIGGIALMILAATLSTWEGRLDRHGPKLF